MQQKKPEFPTCFWWSKKKKQQHQRSLNRIFWRCMIRNSEICSVGG